jgi:hypothetical protein
MRIIITIILIFLLGCQLVIGQSQVSTPLILSIDKDSLIYDDPTKPLSVPITFCNSSSDNLIVYAFSAVPIKTSFDLGAFCERKSTMTGIAFAVYRRDGVQENYEITISDRFDRKPATLETIDSIRKVATDHLLKTKMVLLKNERVSFVKELFLDDFKLTPGIYSLRLIYFCGEKIFKIVDPMEISRNGMQIFQGCTMSKKIPLIVK